MRVVPRRTVVGDIDRRFDNLSGSHHQSHVNCVSSVYGIYVSGTIRNSHDSDDDFRSGCRNVGQCHQQQSFSGLLSPGRSNHTNDLLVRVSFTELNDNDSVKMGVRGNSVGTHERTALVYT